MARCISSCIGSGSVSLRSIVRAIIAMGHSPGLQVIAEGVETPAQVNFPRDAGVDILQGFHFSPTVCSEEFRKLLETQPWSRQSEPPARALHLLTR